MIFTSVISLAISLHDCFTLGALAAGKNSIHNTLSKSTERPTQKKISFKASESYNYSSSALQMHFENPDEKFFALMICPVFANGAS